MYHVYAPAEPEPSVRPSERGPRSFPRTQQKPLAPHILRSRGVRDKIKSRLIRII